MYYIILARLNNTPRIILSSKYTYHTKARSVVSDKVTNWTLAVCGLTGVQRRVWETGGWGGGRGGGVEEVRPEGEERVELSGYLVQTKQAINYANKPPRAEQEV